ncbi:substrate-binding domain-containing protein [Nonomuraea phyllanthi]|nr:substrate-binding domain-containing protein [Nonomuraea phyllanthi]
MTMRILAIALAGALFGTAACGAPASGESSGQLTIGMTVSTMSNPYFMQFRDAAEAAALNSGARLTVTDAANDAARQAGQIQGFTGRHMKAIIVNPVGSGGLGPAIRAAARAGIPVIAADRSISGAGVTQTLTSDNLAGGRLGAQELARQIGGKGEVVVLQGTAGTSASRLRGKGFTEAIAAYPEIKVVARQRADFNRAKGVEAMTRLLRSHPGIDGVFAENDEMALGAVQALGPRAGTHVKVVGYDGTPSGLRAVRAGTMAATVAQLPRVLGWRAVNDAIKAARHQIIPTTVAVPVKVANKGNVREFWSF